MDMRKAHEVTTVFNLNGINKLIVGRYIVIATTASKAGRLVEGLPYFSERNEEIVHVEEMKHIVIIEDENEQS